MTHFFPSHTLANPNSERMTFKDWEEYLDQQDREYADFLNSTEPRNERTHPCLNSNSNPPS